MSNHQIIRITGIPGSGKSFLCSQLTGLTCFDTDDYLTKSFMQTPTKSLDSIEKSAVKLLHTDIKRAQHSVVVVGMTLPVENVSKSYFIRLSAEGLKQAYRRTIAREIEKYKTILNPSVARQIQRLPVHSISTFLRYRYHINAINPVEMTFDAYSKLYQRVLQFEITQGTLIRTQKEIIKELNAGTSQSKLRF
jgi:hypothetical protein